LLSLSRVHQTQRPQAAEKCSPADEIRASFEILYFAFFHSPAYDDTLVVPPPLVSQSWGVIIFSSTIGRL
jgi:hypothetical protein